MKRTTTLRLERLEDRLTPSTTTISFVPDGTQVGAQQSTLFQDAGGVNPAVWQQQLFNYLQQQANQSGVTLVQVGDDGASMNTPAPQDGAIRVAAVNQVFASDGSAVTAPAGQAFEVLGGAVTFGTGLGLTGPNGAVIGTGSQPSTGGLQVILPVQKAYGNLYPSQTSTGVPTSGTITPPSLPTGGSTTSSSGSSNPTPAPTPPTSPDTTTSTAPSDLTPPTDPYNPSY